MKIEKTPGFVTGIKCDLCGVEHEGDFTYYSIDMKEVKVQGNRPVTGMKSIPVTFSMDGCADCVGKLTEAVRAHYSPTSEGVNCDLCGQKLRGSFSYWYSSLTQAIVRLTTGKVECVRCKSPSAGGTKPCKCGSSAFIKVAGVQTDDTYLQIALCQRDYDSLAAAALDIRQRASSEAISNNEPEDQ